METTFQKIIRKTGRKPVSCKCQTCKSQCTKAPCLGTPEDIEKLIDAGYGDRIKATQWATGVVLGNHKDLIEMYQAEHRPFEGCTFFKDGLCELHNTGLKPTEGKLSHHTIKADNYKFTKGISWTVAREWIDPVNAETIKRIEEKLKHATNTPKTTLEPVTSTNTVMP
jgi:hypothetical protein